MSSQENPSVLKALSKYALWGILGVCIAWGIAVIVICILYGVALAF